METPWGFRARTAVVDGTAAKEEAEAMEENLDAAGGWIRGSVSGAANTVNKVGRVGMMEVYLEGF